MRTLLGRFLRWLLELLGLEDEAPGPIFEGPTPFTPTVELVSLPGHGKTSYVWALLYALRRMDQLIPRYACRPKDEVTRARVEHVHRAVGGEVPGSTAGAAEEQLRLELRRVGPYEIKELALRDRRDLLWEKPVPAASVAEETPVVAAPLPAIRWDVPICWLLSLADLKTEDEAVLDLKLDELLHQRRLAGRDFATPLKLILVFTKADRLANLPVELRDELKADPLRTVLAADGNGLASTMRPWSEQDFRGYLAGTWAIHEHLAKWFPSLPAGRLFMARAHEHQVDIRFTLVSATGGDKLCTTDLGMPWAPRRVLDPILFAFDFASPAVGRRAG